MSCAWVFMTTRCRDGHETYTVGFHDPKGVWHPESDHEERDKALDRVAWLNGAADDDSTRMIVQAASTLIAEFDDSYDASCDDGSWRVDACISADTIDMMRKAVRL